MNQEYNCDFQSFQNIIINMANLSIMTEGTNLVRGLRMVRKSFRQTTFSKGKMTMI
jgi:hypothetical protein